MKGRQRVRMGWELWRGAGHVGEGLPGPVCRRGGNRAPPPESNHPVGHPDVSSPGQPRSSLSRAMPCSDRKGCFEVQATTQSSSTGTVWKGRGAEGNKGRDSTPTWLREEEAPASWGSRAGRAQGAGS